MSMSSAARAFPIEAQTPSGKVRGPSLTDQAYKDIRHRIITFVLAPGADFTESDIAGDLEMSKTPVREALLRLQMEGMVQTIPRRGYMVTPLHLSDINDIFDFRESIEGQCAYLAASRATAQDLEEIHRIAEQSSSQVDAEVGNDLDGIFRLGHLNNAFHETVALAAHNMRLHRTVVRVLREYDRFYYLEWVAPAHYPPDHTDHVALAEVLARRDQDGARDAMIHHIENARRTLVSSLTGSGFNAGARLAQI